MVAWVLVAGALAGCAHVDEDGPDGPPLEISLEPPPSRINITEPFTLAWTLNTTHGGPISVVHTAIHWASHSVEDPASPADYGNTTGARSVEAPGRYETPLTLNQSGTYHARAHASYEGREYWSQEYRLTASYPNLEGDWRTLNGTLQLYRLTTWIERWDANATAWTHVQPTCPKFRYYEYDNATRLIYLDNSIALHPSSPGPLTALWLNNRAYGANCFSLGFFGINENPMTRNLPVFGQSPTDDFMFINVTFTRNGTQPPHQIRVHNQTFDEGVNGTVTWEARNPDDPSRLYRARAELEALGPHPYASVRRT